MSKIRRFALYHQTEALLFQFLLHECLCVLKILQKPFCGRTIDELIEPKRGHLHKLCGHFQLLHKQFPESNPLTHPLITKVHLLLNEASALCDECHQLLANSRPLPQGEHKKIKGVFCTITTSLLEKSEEFKENENVLLFLLERHKEFEALAFTEPLASLFKGNGAHLREFLHARFSARGFFHLLPVISKKLEKIPL